MVIYIVAFTLSILLFWMICPGKYNYSKSSINNLTLKINRKSIGVFMASIPLTIVSGCRYYVGTDYLSTYYTGFYRIIDGIKTDGFELGYFFLNKFLNLFTDNVFVLFFITAILFVGFTFGAINVLSDDVILSIVLLLVTRYYFISMNGVRQFIALSILLYSVKFVLEKNIRKFILFVALAMSFHFMSILFIPVYFLDKIKLEKISIIKWIGIDFLVFTIGVKFILEILKNTKYGVLIRRYEVPGIKFTVLTICLNLVIFIIGYKNYNKRYNDIKYRIFINIELIALLISLALQSLPLMERVYWIYSFPLVITLPYMLDEGTKIRKFVVKSLIVLVLAIYMVYDIVVLGDHDVLPYQSIWGKTAVHDSGLRWYR